jgi:hypothetical protein
MRLISRAAGFTFVGVAITACSIGETNYETITLPVREARETRTCDSKFVVPDLAKAKPCGTDGRSHCYPWAKTSVAKEELEPCDDPSEICMPDKLLLAGGKKPQECKFGGGDEGACLPLAFKQIAKNAAALSQDSCEADERCVPCIHPIEKVETGVCLEAGVHEEDCVGGPGEQGDVESCCAGLGVCVDIDSVPAESREDATSMGCSAGTICAPAAMANEKPKRCETFGGFDGICLPKCFAPMLQGADTSDECNAFELCLPCFIAEGQGMPGCE